MEGEPRVFKFSREEVADAERTVNDNGLPSGKMGEWVHQQLEYLRNNFKAVEAVVSASTLVGAIVAIAGKGDEGKEKLLAACANNAKRFVDEHKDW